MSHESVEDRGAAPVRPRRRVRTETGRVPEPMPSGMVAVPPGRAVREAREDRRFYIFDSLKVIPNGSGHLGGTGLAEIAE